jgi:adenine-specific DNA-methyltransferase
MQKMNGQFADIVAENIDQLKALFPEAFTEGKVNFDVLKQLLGGAVDEREEKYGLNWHGKKAARQIALTLSTGTLRPCPEESVDWDTTQNLMIEGDNLEVLKLLQKPYSGKVKMIYIDPPYNTGKDFVYPDDFQDNIKNYLELTGQVEGGNKITSNTEASGRFHTDWLNMMYPRLKIARNLLRDDGVIFISIDDGEVANIRMILDDIFGPENFVADVIWEKKFSPQNDDKYLTAAHDFVVLYAKNKDLWRPNLLERTAEQIASFSNPDNDPRGAWTSGDLTSKTKAEGHSYCIVSPSGKEHYPPTGRQWAPALATFEKMLSEERIWFGKTGDNFPRCKQFLAEIQQGIVPLTLWKHEDVGHNQEAKQEFNALMDRADFETPKPLRLIDKMLHIAATPGAEEEIVMDFFAGSGTSGHAVWRKNSVDNGNRRFILVQLPEPTKILNYPTIADLTKERLRRAGKKVKDENPLFAGDLGFRVFKLDTSNINSWDPNRDDLEQTLLDHMEHIKPGRSEADILYELLLKLGLDLCVPIEDKTIAGKTVHSIGSGVLFACLAGSITSNEAEPLALGMIEWHKSLAPAGDTTCVFRDSAFADDVAKSNLAAILEQHGISTVRSL